MMNTIPEKKLSAGAVVVRRFGRDWKILVLRSYRNWDFPKGMVEPGEDPLAAATREVAEETGLADLDFPFGDNYRDTVPYSDNKVARYYLAETAQASITLPISHELGRPEHDEWRWVTCDQAEDLLPPRLGIVLEWVRETLDCG